MSLKQNISLNFISQIVNLVTSFGTSILLSRVLGPEGRGDYILILTSAGFLVQFFTFGIESSITHFIASSKINVSKLMISVLIFVALIIFLIITGTLLVSFYTNRLLIPSPNIHYYVILIFLVLFTFLQNVLVSILNGVKAFRTVIIISTLTNILILISSLMFFVFWKDKPGITIPLLYVTAAVHFTITMLYIYNFTKYVHLKKGSGLMNRKEMNWFFTYAFISFAGSVIQYLNYKMDFWVINYYWGSSSLGIYSLSASLAQLLWILPQSVATIMFPMTSFYKHDELVTITERLVRISVFITFLIVLPLFILAPFFIPFLFGGEFSDSAVYFRQFLIGIFPFIVIKILASVFAGIGKVSYNLVAAIVGFIAGSIAYLILIPRLGLTGGVVGSIISYVLTTSVAVYYYLRKFPTSSFGNLVFIKQGDIRYLYNQVVKVMRLKR